MNTLLPPPTENEIVPGRPLPTRETIANGVMLQTQNPIFLKKPDKYQVYLAVEEEVRHGLPINDVLQRIGLTRALYYDYFWFTDEQAAAFEATMQADAETMTDNGAEAAPTQEARKEKRRLDARGILHLLNEVSRLRYVEQYEFDKACRMVGITRRKFYDWSTRRSLFERFIKRQERVNGRKTNDIHTASQPFVEVDAATLEKRKELVSEVHRQVVRGTKFRTALRQAGVRADKYHTWLREIEQSHQPEEKPIDLWNRYKNGENKEEALKKLILRFTPTAEYFAARYARRSRELFGTNIDEALLVSAALYEGIVQNIDRYNPDGAPITAYFGQKMAQRILDEIRNQDWVPRVDRKKNAARYKAEEQFFRLTGRLPHHDTELLEYLGEEFQTSALHPPYHVSLDATLRNNRKNDGSTMHDFIGEKDIDSENANVRELVERLLKKCDTDERAVLEGYYLQEMSLKEVGTSLGLSESRISQKHAAAIVRLREIFRRDPDMPKVHTKEKAH